MAGTASALNDNLDVADPDSKKSAADEAVDENIDNVD